PRQRSVELHDRGDPRSYRWTGHVSVTAMADPATVEQRLAAIDARLQELEDREAIRHVLYTYARGVDRCDADILKERVYFADATDLHGWTFGGNAHEFVDHVLELLRHNPINRHMISNPNIELDGDRAFVESYYISTHRLPVDGGV